ncbi:MAG: acetyl-CoA carboxylase carboxyltransferase subunit beta [Myxococcales bacterium]|nr:acetyl-CoA carboxylase carboxyltransferase subunit beta [Myxococcales bacterium]
MAFPSKTPAQSHESEKKSFGKGLFQKCTGCGAVNTAEEMRQRWHVCPECGYHHPMSPDDWRRLLLDDAKLERFDEHISPADPLQFFDGKSYQDRVRAAQAATRRGEGIEVGRALLDGHPVGYGCFVFKFMGGSMGSVVGERITRLFERATSERLPVLLLHASGGARMQEGILSLMQMAKTVAALRRFREVRRPFISICLHPTTGGVAASTAFLGDVNVVEPNALIGFAGPRVIENTIRTKLPEGFQRSAFLLEHGMVDTIVPRAEMKQKLSVILSILAGGAVPPAPSSRRVPKTGAST